MLSAKTFEIHPAPEQAMLRVILKTACWSWINLLMFNVSNQRHPRSIAEDAVNKPWRPMPTKRLTVAQASGLMWLVLPVSLAASVLLGGWRQCMALVLLTWTYKDLGGGNLNGWGRNVNVTLGIIFFLYGAFEVALGRPLGLTSPRVWPWLLTNSALLLTTIHAQDMADQPGDAARGRKTVPLTIGDVPARWTLAVLVPLWTVFCTEYWKLVPFASLAYVALCGAVAVRTLLMRTVAADQGTYLLYNVWLMSLYFMPLIKQVSQ